MPKQNLATTSKIASMLPGAADAGGRSSRAISCKNHTIVSVLAQVNQQNAAPVTFTLTQAQDASGLNAKPISNPLPIWANQDTVAADTMARQADGVAFTTSAALAHKQVIFHVDPSNLDVNGGYGYVILTTSASNAANITSALAIGDQARYQNEGGGPSLLT
jgi:hypothetical protein